MGRSFDKDPLHDKILFEVWEDMRDVKKAIQEMACRYGLQMIYAFGSRAREVKEMLEGRIERLPPGSSDLDIGVKPERGLTVEEKVQIAIFFEDLFEVGRVDLVVLPEAPVFLALKIVTGEILYSQDPTREAEYQLYVMRQAAELMPYERMKQRMIMDDSG